MKKSSNENILGLILFPTLYVRIATIQGGLDEKMGDEKEGLCL